MAEIKKRKQKRPVHAVYRSHLWKATREAMSHSKSCYMCGSSNGKVLDHKVKWKLGGSVYGTKNLGWLCPGCDKYKYRVEMMGYVLKYRTSHSGLYPANPLRWIPVPAGLKEAIAKYGINNVRQGTAHVPIPVDAGYPLEYFREETTKRNQ